MRRTLGVVQVVRQEDGSCALPLTEDVWRALKLKDGDRLVWTIVDGAVTVRKRSRRYKLKPGELESTVREGEAP